jgi:hypothetical protein
MNQNNLDTIKHFIRYCKEELNIQSLPKIKLIADKNFVSQFRSYGEYSVHLNQLRVFYPGRNLADVCRSLAHELVHHRQNELDMLANGSGETGTEIENEANAMAGILMRDYGKLNLSVYDLDAPSTALTEARQVGKLYYFGPYRRLDRLVNNGFKLTSTIQPFVSFTRNKSMVSDTIANEVRITIDGDKLSQRHKITPFAHSSAGYGRSSADEAEERIDLSKHPQGVDISKAIISVEIMNPLKAGNAEFDDEESFEPPSLEAYASLIRSLKKNNIPYKIVDSFK